MNIVLLVEGAETEPQVYRAWLGQRLPALRPALAVADLTSDGYVLISGKGYPSYARRLAGLLADIDEQPGRVDELWICIDSDDDTYEQRHADVAAVVADTKSATQLHVTNPHLAVRVIVQHCCIETWFLGHEGFARAATQSREVVEFKRFYDVSVDDPERMGCPPRYPTRQSFHEAYLKAMLAETGHLGHRYTKQRPRVVLEPSYFDALQSRAARTGHLPSFQKLLDALRAAGDRGA